MRQRICKKKPAVFSRRVWAAMPPTTNICKPYAPQPPSLYPQSLQERHLPSNTYAYEWHFGHVKALPMAFIFIFFGGWEVIKGNSVCMGSLLMLSTFKVLDEFLNIALM